MTEREINSSDERAPGLFQPDTLTPSQFFDRLRRSSEHDGNRRLMIAVLEDAIDVYRKRLGSRDRRSQELFHQAEEWIESRDGDWFFSFENICAVLDLDADFVRGGLRRWRERQLAAARARVLVFPPQDDAAVPELRKAGGHG
ncbi:MAG: hypothetical protein U0807_04955 [Candidatus Binatia bacterium]